MKFLMEKIVEVGVQMLAVVHPRVLLADDANLLWVWPVIEASGDA
jgi:hypothetical protein